MRKQFVDAIKANQNVFGLEIPDLRIERLADYYDLVQLHNPLLHLVGRCSPEEFATRHIFESLTMLEFLPANAKFCDVGSGAGLPAIPCLIVREDLTATLIESKEKKADFLSAAVNELGLSNPITIVNRQFTEGDPGVAAFVTCRALDKFTERLSRLVKWANRRTLLFFGGPSLRSEMERLSLKFESRLMPLSEQRFLFAVTEIK
jgi:16S rRNA (guanine527-N7)-methyltransferase